MYGFYKRRQVEGLDGKYLDGIDDIDGIDDGTDKDGKYKD